MSLAIAAFRLDHLAEDRLGFGGNAVVEIDQRLVVVSRVWAIVDLGKVDFAGFVEIEVGQCGHEVHSNAMPVRGWQAARKPPEVGDGPIMTPTGARAKSRPARAARSDRK